MNSKGRHKMANSHWKERSSCDRTWQFRSRGGVLDCLCMLRLHSVPFSLVFLDCYRPSPVSAQGSWETVLTAVLCMWKSLQRVRLMWPLCDLCSPPGSSIHGIFQARILERVATSFSRGSSRPRDWTQVSHIAGGLVTVWTTREALFYCTLERPLSNVQYSLCFLLQIHFLPFNLLWILGGWLLWTGF